MSLILSGTNGLSDVDGSAATPAIRGTDTNTGIFFPAADTLVFSTNGTEDARFDSAGNFGIGTTSPTGGANRVVDVYGSGSSAINFHNATSGTTSTDGGVVGQYGSDLVLFNYEAGIIQFGTSNSERMRLDASGNLGVGTTSPTQRLDVYGTGMKVNNASYVGYLGSGSTFAGGAASDFCVRSDNVLSFGTGGPYERARIDSSGRLLVGGTGLVGQIGVTCTDNSINAIAATHNGAGAGVLNVNDTSTSYTGNVTEVNCNRSQNSAYSLSKLWSGNYADVEFNLRGDGNGYADGTWNNNGADYAEFFESTNGLALTVGATVVLEGNKVREATSQDAASDVIGVVRPKEPSKASMVIGNTAWNKWAEKYLTDDFDRYIMEDHDVLEWTDEEGKQHSYESHNIPTGVVVPDDAVRSTHDGNGNKFQHYKLNPAWNPNVEYVNRENRAEWNIIGLLGQVKILKGQPVGDRWVKMRDVSDSVEEWMIR